MSAKKEESKAAEGEAAPKRRGGKILVILGGVLFLVLALGGTGLYFLLKEPTDDEHAEEIAKKKEKSKPKVQLPPPMFAKLEPFIVNLGSADGQFLQISMELEVDTPDGITQVKAFTPKLRSHIMLLISGKKPAELSSKEGKEQLAVEIRKQVNEVLNPPLKGREWDDRSPVTEVLFTSFIIQ